MLILVGRKNSKIVPKRYRLAEFHAPYLPDQDQQELPNSKPPPCLDLSCLIKPLIEFPPGVVLDFRDGSTLQCACENAYAQTEVLQALKRAHRTSNPAR